MSFRGAIPRDIWYSFCCSPLELRSNRLYPRLQPCEGSTWSYPRQTTSKSRRCFSSSSHELDKLQNQVANSSKEAKTAFFRQRSMKAKGFRKIQDRIQKQSNTDIEFLLRKDSVEKPNIRNTIRLLRTLLHDRQIRPSARHYMALILANADRDRGSPSTVRNLLDEMEAWGIPADSATLHAALRVLAVHPDYILRQDILRKLRERWMLLSAEGWHFVVCGLIRENQFELALDHMSEMERKEIPIESWLHKTIVYNLCELEEFEEVYRLMKSRLDQGYEITERLWSHVLQTAINASHYDLTRYIWQRMVDLEHLKPSPKTCKQTFAMAAGKADLTLVVSVARFCIKNNLHLPGYNGFLRNHLGLSLEPDTFKTISVIHEAGLPLNASFTNPVLSNLIETNADPREAWQTLKRLKNDGHQIPLESVQIITELCEHMAPGDPSVVDDALGFYRDLDSLCPDGADVEVFNSFIRICRNANRHDSGMIILKEMTNHGVVPNKKTFETLILMCLDARQYRSAYMYFVDLQQRGEPLSRETQMEIRQECAKSVHEFAMKLQYHPAVKYDQTEAPPVKLASSESHDELDSPWRPLIHREQAAGGKDGSPVNKNDTP